MFGETIDWQIWVSQALLDKWYKFPKTFLVKKDDSPEKFTPNVCEVRVSFTSFLPTIKRNQVDEKTMTNIEGEHWRQRRQEDLCRSPYTHIEGGP